MMCDVGMEEELGLGVTWDERRDDCTLAYKEG